MSIKRKTGFHHLNQKDRERIDILMREGHVQKEIAKKIGCNPCTISREIRRNITKDCKQYIASIAQTKTFTRKSFCIKKLKLDNPILVSYVKDKLSEGWSPEQITGRIKNDHPHMSISYETIYRYVYSKNDIEHKKLISLLPRAHKKRKRKYPNKIGRKTKILNRTGIEDRPAVINERKELGHWETDTMVCKSNIPAISTTVERVTKYVILTKLNKKNAYNKACSLIRRLSKIRNKFRLSITYDNGTENAGHVKVNKALGTKSYFAHPYRSWERGTNENSNGLVRRFIPKKTDLNSITRKQLSKIEYKINSRPRKCLYYKTALEVTSSLNFFKN